MQDGVTERVVISSRNSWGFEGGGGGGTLLCIINELHNQEVNPKTQQNNKTRKLLLLEKIELWPHSHHCFVLILSQLLLNTQCANTSQWQSGTGN